MLNRVLLFFLALHLAPSSFSQDTAGSVTISSRYIDHVSRSSSAISGKLDKKTAKILSQFKKTEAKVKTKLSAQDSTAAASLFAGTEQQYKELEQRLNGSGNKYIAEIDSLATSLNFLQANPQFLKEAEEVKEKLQEATKKLEELKSGFANAETVRQFLKQRRQHLQDQLSKFGFARELKRINKQVY